MTLAYLCTSVQNMSNYCNPEFDKLFYEQRQEKDAAKRIQIIDKMQQILWDDMVMAPISRGVNLQLSYTHVKGWRNYWYDSSCCSQGFQMANVWLDK